MDRVGTLALGPFDGDNLTRRPHRSGNLFLAAFRSRQLCIRALAGPAIHRRRRRTHVDRDARSLAVRATRNLRRSARHAGEIRAVRVLLKPHHSPIAFHALAL